MVKDEGRQKKPDKNVKTQRGPARPDILEERNLVEPFHVLPFYWWVRDVILARAADQAEYCRLSPGTLNVSLLLIIAAGQQKTAHPRA
jgi:hypothetical protein